MTDKDLDRRFQDLFGDAYVRFAWGDADDELEPLYVLLRRNPSVDEKLALSNVAVDYLDEMNIMPDIETVTEDEVRRDRHLQRILLREEAT